MTCIIVMTTGITSVINTYNTKHPSKKCHICMFGMTILFIHSIELQIMMISTYKVYNGRTATVHTAAATRGCCSPRPAGRARRRP